MNFIFFWRLVREKGFDLIVASLRDFETLPGNFFLFGDGPLRAELLTAFADDSRFVDASSWSEEELYTLTLDPLSSLPHPNPLLKVEGEVVSEGGVHSPSGGRGAEERGGVVNKIYFFSWRSRDIISQFLRVSDFSLMPSRFLETFGLSALESLAEWVPVIGWRKWGLIPFVDPSLAIAPGDTDAALARNLSETIERAVAISDRRTLSEGCREIATRYAEDRWMAEAKKILGDKTNKILLVSDYIAPLGGIETHVSSIAETLRRNGYTVETFGWHIPVNRFTRLLRLAGLVVSGYNFPFAMRFRKYLKTYEPDFIWFHNVSRFLGPAVVYEGMRYGAQSAITYHELGVFTPFPSETEKEDEIASKWSLPTFLAASHSLSLITHLAIVCKFFQLSLLRTQLKRIHTHIVPSEFMRVYLRNNLGIEEDRIVTLEHYRT